MSCTEYFTIMIEIIFRLLIAKFDGRKSIRLSNLVKLYFPGYFHIPPRGLIITVRKNSLIQKFHGFL